ncbi:MAG: hypothetical protein K2R98_31340 [Gemmataceae bacterium]|nr:hypothetical protein [Gemmataceae bacterium]
MARRILNRKDLRADYDAAERRKSEGEEAEETEEEAEDDIEDEEEGEAAEGEAAEGDADEDEDAEEDEGDEDEDAPKKKKKKPAKVKVAKPKAKPRSRAAKVVRMKVVWGVFSNSNQQVATYDYPQRKEADDHAAKLTADKKSTHFVQPVKKAIEEKKEKE